MSALYTSGMVLDHLPLALVIMVVTFALLNAVHVSERLYGYYRSPSQHFAIIGRI